LSNIALFILIPFQSRYCPQAAYSAYIFRIKFILTKNLADWTPLDSSSKSLCESQKPSYIVRLYAEHFHFGDYVFQEKESPV